MTFTHTHTYIENSAKEEEENTVTTAALDTVSVRV